MTSKQQKYRVSTNLFLKYKNKLKYCGKKTLWQCSPSKQYLKKEKKILYMISMGPVHYRKTYSMYTIHSKKMIPVYL